MHKILPWLVVVGFIFAFANAGSSEPERQRGADGDLVWRSGTEIAQKKKEKGKFDPPKIFEPSQEVLDQILAKTAQLSAKIADLRANGQRKLGGGNLTTHELLPDVEIYLRGARNIVQFKEYFNKDSAKWTLDCLDEGMLRAQHLAKGQTPWTELSTRNVLRAYRSRIDGTAQPYGVTYPLSYNRSDEINKPYRVDIVLHGRNASLTEVAFLNTHNGKKKPAADQDWIQIDIFGRGNNAYRWAGETDVFEAMEAFFANELKHAGGHHPDRRKVVLRGFSMGGAGTWHLGLHHPDKWCVMGPGAGFTTTHDYAWKGKKELPDYQEKCLRIYDAIDYVENARMIPIVAYSGGDDPQKLAADNIENRLKELKIDRMTHLVKPGVGHKFEPDYFAKANALWSAQAAKGRPATLESVELVTYTVKYPYAYGVFITGLHRHYEKAYIRCEQSGPGPKVVTRNVRTFTLGTLRGDHSTIVVDGQMVDMGSKCTVASFEQVEGRWKMLPPIEGLDDALRRIKELTQKLEKRHGLQGPIDDAFASAFTCVLGSGDTFHPATQKFVDAKVVAFRYDWAKHFRGELPTIGDYAVTPNEIMDKNLILFGDPQSNLTLAQIMPKLPIRWTKDEIEFGGKKYKASEHVPVMIFPNPLNPMKYVVLNTGHTWPSADYTKTNALLYPRLGDYAILRMADGSVATAGLFDEFWRVENK
ncbi:MAG: alpha/beta hydrolase [Planctomycetes bacterium]|nr:alpha/beta hydrolase [Planctomycetota bacterium]